MDEAPRGAEARVMDDIDGGIMDDFRRASAPFLYQSTIIYIYMYIPRRNSRAVP